MTDYKIGDKVRIIAAEDTERYKNGDILTVSDLSYGEEARHVMVICADGKQELAYLREIEPYTPDVITINRADLPEVVVDGQHLLAGKNTFGRFLEADGHREVALSQLAVAEYLEREKAAEKESATKRNKRRDELAELFSGIPGTRYGLRNRDLRNAIDYIVDFEASHD